VPVHPGRYLAQQVGAAFVGGIEVDVHAILPAQVVDERPTITAQACGITYYPFGIVSDNHG